jgi:hypothetical protein
VQRGKDLKNQAAILASQLEKTFAKLEEEALKIPNDTHPEV